MVVEVTWMQPYLAYMLNKTLSEDVVEARRIMQWSKEFVVVKGELYKKSISGVYQRCVTPQEGQARLHDIHAGVCGHHASSQASSQSFQSRFLLVNSSRRRRGYRSAVWSMQRFTSRPHAPTAELQSIPLSWPFAQWVLDMVGKLHKSWPGRHVYMLVAVDKFTKWTEAAPVTTQIPQRQSISSSR
jgi:hypothetical protein